MILRHAGIAACALLLAGLPATAAAPGAAAPAWAVDQSRSRLGFSGAMQGEGFTGQFSAWDAQITFDPDNLAASAATVTIDMASAETGDSTRDTALPDSDWFAVRLFPQATFTTSSISATGEGEYLAEGQLTIRGISHPVSLPFSLDITDGKARMRGSLTIDRTSFGVGQGAWSSGNSVATEVTIDLRVAADLIG